MNSIKMFSVNTRGLNGSEKRKRIFENLCKEKGDVIMLQETHIGKYREYLLRDIRLGKLIASASTSDSAGTAMYINESKIEIQKIYEETEEKYKGRVMMIQVCVNEKVLNIANIYAPNNNRTEFFSYLYRIMTSFDNSAKWTSFDNSAKWIIGGDMNFVMSEAKDRSTDPKNNRSTLCKAMEDLINNFDLVDVWRFHHVDTREYTFYSHRHKTSSRIDIFFVSEPLLRYVKKAEIIRTIGIGMDINKAKYADHNPIVLELEMNTGTLCQTIL